MTKKLNNGVVLKSTLVNATDDKAKNENFPAQKANSAIADFNLTEMLMMAASSKEVQFTPDIMSHITDIHQLGVVKRPVLNPIANVPLLLPPVSPGSTFVPDLIDPTILTLLNSELTKRLPAGGVTSSVRQYVRQGRLI